SPRPRLPPPFRLALALLYSSLPFPSPAPPPPPPPPVAFPPSLPPPPPPPSQASEIRRSDDQAAALHNAEQRRGLVWYARSESTNIGRGLQNQPRPNQKATPSHPNKNLLARRPSHPPPSSSVPDGTITSLSPPLALALDRPRKRTAFAPPSIRAL
ncbi:hypothetical protein MARPO_0063s0001, partial [Marchantia polymorpha]